MLEGGALDITNDGESGETQTFSLTPKSARVGVHYPLAKSLTMHEAGASLIITGNIEGGTKRESGKKSGRSY